MSCTRASVLTPPTRASWAVLLYLAGGCELEPFMTRRLWDLEAETFHAEVLVQLGRAPQRLVASLTGRTPTGIDGDWTGVRRYRLRPRQAGQDEDDRRFNSECLQDLGEANMADPRTLRDFVRWGLDAAAADHFLVVLAGHGAGLFGALTDLVSGPPQTMGIPGTAQALSQAQAKSSHRVDILLLDTCYMNLVEAAYELSVTVPRAAAYLVVPVDSSPLAGLPYEELSLALSAVAEGRGGERPGEPAAVAREIVSRLNRWLSEQGFPGGLAGITLDERLFAPVAAEACRLVECLHGSSSSGSSKLAHPIRLARLHNLVVAAGADLVADPCAEIAAEFRARLAETVLCTPAYVEPDRRHKCYSMYLPVTGGRFTPDCAGIYRQLAFARETGLGETIAPSERFPGLVQTLERGVLPGPTSLPAHIYAPSPFDAPVGQSKV